MGLKKISHQLRLKLHLSRRDHAEEAKAQSTKWATKQWAKAPNEGPRETIEEQSIEVVEAESVGVSGEQSADFGRFQTGPDDRVIAVMGLTGTGKSTFISLFTDEHVEVSGNLESCTSNVAIYQCPMAKGTLHLLDTPGFDDTHKSETEVLREIAAYLSFAYNNQIHLSGIIYLHRITDNKLGGSALRNLHMFKKLCGDASLASVVLATSWWSEVDLAVGQDREKQLTTTKEFWGGMIDKGSKVFQHDGSQHSARKIIDYLVELSRPVVLDIQYQMVEQHLTLDMTGAGQEVGGELQRQQQRYAKELSLARQEIQEAMDKKDLESAAQIRKTEEEFTNKLKKINQDQEALRISHNQARLQQEQEIRRQIEEQRRRLEAREVDLLKREHEIELRKLKTEEQLKIMELKFNEEQRRTAEKVAAETVRMEHELEKAKIRGDNTAMVERLRYQLESDKARYVAELQSNKQGCAVM